MKGRGRRLHPESAATLLRGELRLDPLNGTGSEPQGLCDLDDTDTLRKLLLRLFCDGSIDLRSPERSAGFGSVCLGARDAGAHPLPDHRPLELGKGAGDLEDELSYRRGRVDCLLVEVQVDPDCFQVLDRAQQVDERAPEPYRSPTPSPHRISGGPHP